MGTDDETPKQVSKLTQYLPVEVQDQIKQEIASAVGTAVGAAVKEALSGVVGPLRDQIEGLNRELGGLKDQVKASRSPMSPHTQDDWSEHEANEQGRSQVASQQPYDPDGDEDGLNERATTKYAGRKPYKPGSALDRPGSSFLG